jgi:uncharacterized protein
MVAGDVREKIERYLEAVRGLGIPVRRAVLFGSWARGEAREWSDIDLVIVSPVFDAPHARREVALLWDALAATGGYIEPIPCGERRWEEDGGSPVIEIARREGVEVYSAA